MDTVDKEEKVTFKNPYKEYEAPESKTPEYETMLCRKGKELTQLGDDLGTRNRPNIHPVNQSVSRSAAEGLRQLRGDLETLYRPNIHPVNQSVSRSAAEGRRQLRDDLETLYRPNIHPVNQSVSLKEIACSDVEFHKRIGRGRFSEVYHVTLTKICKGHTEAAAKKIFVTATEVGSMLISKLSHQHIACVFGFGYFYHSTFLFLELAPYGSLHDHLIKNQFSIPEGLIRKWMKECALAIEYLHAKNILHMDIKAKNCLVFHNFTLKLCDIGLASKLSEQGFTQSTVEDTWMYLAPEIIKPSEGTNVLYSKQSDIFAYGMLLLEICTRGLPLYEGTGTVPTIAHHCPQDVSDLMRRCRNPVPNQRPAIGSIIEELAYWELVSARNAGLDSVNVNAAPIFHEKSVDVGKLGGWFEIENTGVSVEIPYGAISSEEPVEITVSVHWDKEYHHTVQGNEYVIGPAIHCKPDGMRFKKPIQITFPHSAENITEKQLTVWTRASNAPGNHQWRKLHTVVNQGPSVLASPWVPWGNQGSITDENTVIVESNKIKLRVYHFSGFSSSIFSSRWNRFWHESGRYLLHGLLHSWVWLQVMRAITRLWLWRPQPGLQPGPQPGPQPILRWVFLLFMQPATLVNKGVFIKVYAVREDAVGKILTLEENSKAYECARRTWKEINLTDRNMSDIEVAVQILTPRNEWTPTQEKKTIEFAAFQYGGTDSNCYAFFEKSGSTKEIMGKVEVFWKSEGASDKRKPLVDIPFSNTSTGVKPVSLQPLLPISTRRKRLPLESTDQKPTRETVETPGSEKLTIRHFNDIVNQLEEYKRYTLFKHLRMSEVEIGDARKGNDEEGISAQQATRIFNYWRNQEPKEATIGAILDALKRCKNNEKKNYFHDLWTKEHNKGYADKLKDEDITELVTKLSPREMEDLFPELGLEMDDIDKASVGTTASEKTKALRTLTAWRKRDPDKATTTTIIDAFCQLDFMEDARALKKKWKC